MEASTSSATGLVTPPRSEDELEDSAQKDRLRMVPFSESNSKEQDILLLEPYTHLLTVQGKNIRRKLISGFNTWMNVDPGKLMAIGDIVQMLHNASLLLDDIEDNSLLRRGIPVAHKIYGEASTINCANYVMFIGLEKVLGLGHHDATAVFTEQLLELHRGQGMEIYWRDNYICPTEEDYRLMVTRKTGGLFNLAVRLMQLFSEFDENFTELTRLLGLYFQIRDDYANLKLDEYAANKSFAEDLTEGKFSFPIVHAIQTQPDDNRVLKIIRQRTVDIEVKKFCISLLESAGSFSYTLSVMSDLDESIRAEIARLGGNPTLEAVMDELRNWD